MASFGKQFKNCNWVKWFCDGGSIKWEKYSGLTYLLTQFPIHTYFIQRSLSISCPPFLYAIHFKHFPDFIMIIATKCYLRGFRGGSTNEIDGWLLICTYEQLSLLTLFLSSFSFSFSSRPKTFSSLTTILSTWRKLSCRMKMFHEILPKI